MTDIHLVSQQAFNEEIGNWEITLQRQMKKLKLLKKTTNNKLQINTIEIAIIEM